MKNLVTLIRQGLLQAKTSEAIQLDTWSSVAFVLKPSSTKLLNLKEQSLLGYDLLLLRRKPDPKDHFSGHVCLPGGKKQPGQSSIQTAIRQCFEESGIKLQKKHILRVINRRFLARLGLIKGKMVPMMVEVVVFFLNNENPQIHIDNREVENYKWVPLSDFLLGEQIQARMKIPIIQYSLVQLMDLSIEQQNELITKFQWVSLPAFKLGLKMPLFGFTFYVIWHVLGCIRDYGLQSQIWDPQTQSRFQRLQEFVWDIKAKFKDDYPQKQQAEKLIIQNYKSLRIESQLVLPPKL